MKNKLLRLFLLICAVFIGLIGITKVNAESYNGEIIEGEWISGVFVRKDYGSTHKYQQGRFIRRSDGAYVYCIQPFVSIISGANYEVTTSDFAQIAGMTQAQWNRVSRLAYYGYGYPGHEDKKWYTITQVLIWRTVAPDADIYFTNTLNGTRNDSLYVSEINELNNMVNNHGKTPNISLPSETVIGNTISSVDTNGVLEGFEIRNVNGGTVTKNGNNIYVTPNTVGTMSFNLTKDFNRYGEPTYLYYATNSQNVMRRGNIDPVNVTLNITVFGGKVTTDKDDKETTEPQGEATLNGAVYGIYDETGTLIEKVTTGEDGVITSNYLPKLGNFYLQEITAPKGYVLDNTKYNFTITNDNLNPTVKVYDMVIKNKFKYTKVYAQNETGSMRPEPNATFGIYNNKGEEIFKVTSDNNGEFDFELPYGTYTMKQLTTSTGTEKIKDITLIVSEDGKEETKVLANAQISAKLKVIKIDKDTKEVIKRSGIKFKILNTKTNEYVCQTITYPERKTICEYETDKNGEFTTPYPLLTGTYKLEEIDQVIDGYLWNKESLEFTIDENSKLIDDEYGIIFETNFENKAVKGEVKINKVGEVANLKENGYTFTKESLEGITFGLYQNDKEVATGKTDKEGKLTFTDLKLGKYCVKELKTLDGYILNTNPVCFELKYKDQYTEVITYETLIENKLKTSKLEFTKTDFSTDETLPNTTMKIFTMDDELVYEGKTNEEGKIVIDRLPIGKYYLLESEAPEGYLINEEKMYFEVTGDDEVVKSNMKDKRITGSLEFTKTDFSTDETLPNTLIQIFNEKDELIYEGRTDENGKITIDEIPYGKYYILEKEAPEGYELNTEKMWFEVLEDGTVIKSTMKDHKIVKVPNTEANDYHELIISGITMIVAGIGLVVLSKKKKSGDKDDKK